MHTGAENTVYNSFVKVATSIDSDADRISVGVQPASMGFRIVVERPGVYVGRESNGIEVRSVARPLPDGQQLLIRKRAGEEICGIPVTSTRNLGTVVSVGFTSDSNFAGKVVNVRLLDKGKLGGTFVAEELDRLRGLFLNAHQGSADRLIDRFMFDPGAFLIPSRTCSELDIKTGEHVSLMKDPTVRKLEALLR